MEHDVFTPGRLCILGEHTDWAGQHRLKNPSVSVGATIVCSTNEGLYAKCSYYKQGKIKFDSISFLKEQNSFEYDLVIDELILLAQKGGFFSVS